MRRPDLSRLAPQTAFAAILLVCALLPFARERAPEAAPTAAPEWPLAWDGQPLRPLALSPVEQRFAANFPGHIARLTDGTQTLVMRAVHRATRQLHPAADCYRGLGYTLRDVRLEADAQQRLWRCFVAERGPQAQRVCERIVDAAGHTYTDTSSWYWSAVTGASTGPWQAITIARPM